jgi:hypothetical protein
MTSELQPDRYNGLIVVIAGFAYAVADPYGQSVVLQSIARMQQSLTLYLHLLSCLGPAG